MSRISKEKKNREWMLVALFYFVCVAFRFLIGNYFRNIHVYADDQIYYHMAESFAQGRGFKVCNADRAYRILYPIFLSPAFLFNDRHIQMSLLQFINSALISSTIFPFAIIVKRVLETGKMRILAYCVFLLSADLTYSMTFMSENLFFPISMWVVCLIMQYVWDEESRSNKKHILIFITGVLIYLSYTIKNAAILLLIVSEGMLFLDTLWLYIQKKDKKKLCDRLIDIAIVMAVFVVLKKLGDRTWLYRDPSLYYQGEPLKVKLNFLDMAKSFIYLSATALIAAGILPLIMPGIYFKKLNVKARKLYVMTCIMFGLGMLALTWYNRKGIGREMIRPHLRYVIYMWLIIQVCFWALMEKKIEGKILRNTIIFFLPVALCAVIFKGTFDGTTIDQTLCYYIIRFFTDRINILRIAVAAVGILAIPFMQKYQRIAFAAFMVFYIGIQLVNNALIIKYHHQDYALSEDIYRQIKPLEDLVEKSKEYNFAVIMEGDISTRGNRLMDTFINKENVYEYYYDGVKEIWNKRGTVPAFSNIENPYGVRYADLDRIDYIFIKKDTGYHWDEEMMTQVDGYENDYWSLYSLNDPQKLPEFYALD